MRRKVGVESLLLGLLFQSCGTFAKLRPKPQSDGKADIRITEIEVDPGSNGIPVIITGDIGIGIGGGGENEGGATTLNPTGPTTVLPGGSTLSPGVVRGLECGSTRQMFPGNTVQVFSTNFGVANYYNNEACTWKFEANQCTLSAFCPCVDIPRSWECLGDYLKISTDLLENQRFCGGNRPGQPIYSDTDFLGIRFRSDGRQTATGFTCFVRCDGPGQTPPPPMSVTCPTNVSG